VNLSDRLVFEENGSFALHTDHHGLPTDDANLVIRSARLLQAAAGASRGVSITLEKRIPVAAGLGGGSSDAAATLWGLNRLWGLRWSIKRLDDLARELGMDVPFFLRGGRALATGRGEILRPLPPSRGMSLVLVNPNFPLTTREVYARVPADVSGDGSRTRMLTEALGRGNVTRVAANLYNSLEALVERDYPVIAQIKSALLAAGALGVVMSGTGPTVVGMARSFDHARQLRARLARRRGWSCWAVRGVSGPAIRVLRS
jgi:4-diphosphocytidyl-2-C-methyl-D-erythritol kinase